MYIRNYEIYRFHELSLEEAKKIVADESNFLYEEQFGEPIETGVEYMNQIIESEKDGYKKIELYATSDDKYYIGSINKRVLIVEVIFIGAIPVLLFTFGGVIKIIDEQELLKSYIDRLSLAEEAIQKISLAEEAIQKTKKLV